MNALVQNPVVKAFLMLLKQYKEDRRKVIPIMTLVTMSEYSAVIKQLEDCDETAKELIQQFKNILPEYRRRTQYYDACRMFDENEIRVLVKGGNDDFVFTSSDGITIEVRFTPQCVPFGTPRLTLYNKTEVPKKEIADVMPNLLTGREMCRTLKINGHTMTVKGIVKYAEDNFQRQHGPIIFSG